MQVVTGHKGGLGGLETHVRGFEVHSSIMHTGVSAVHEAARLIDWANRMNDKVAEADKDPIAAMFDPPWTTSHVGEVHGGTANNITAKDCIFTMAFRCVPTEDPPETWRRLYMEEIHRVEAAMKAVHPPDARIDVNDRFAVPGLRPPEEDGAAELLARQLTGGDNASHVVSYATEAGQFQDGGGYSAVVCGPPGNIEQAHQPNEFITVKEFNRGWAFMQKLIEHLR